MSAVRAVVLLLLAICTGCMNSRLKLIAAGQQHPDIIALFAPRISDGESPIRELDASACVGTDEFGAKIHAGADGDLFVDAKNDEVRSPRSARFLGVDTNGRSVFLYDENFGGSGNFASLIVLEAFLDRSRHTILRYSGAKSLGNRIAGRVTIKEGKVVSTMPDGTVTVLLINDDFGPR